MQYAREHVAAIFLSLSPCAPTLPHLVRTMMPPTDRNACNGGLMLTKRCHLTEDLLGLMIQTPTLLQLQHGVTWLGACCLLGRRISQDSC